MGELTFKTVENEKYNTFSIMIDYAILTLRGNYMVQKIEKTKWKYRKCVVHLEDPELRERVKNWETQINAHLKTIHIEPIKILYGDKIYPKTLMHAVKRDVDMWITPKSVWINNQNKPFIQLWLE